MSTLARDLGKASLKPPTSGRHPSKSILQGYHFLGVLRLDSLTNLEEKLALFGQGTPLSSPWGFSGLSYNLQPGILKGL